MWHLLMAHQQESFHPFSSRQSLSCFLSHVAKRSNPKPHRPDSCPSHRVPTPPKPCGAPLLLQSRMILSLVWLPCPGFKSLCRSSSAAPFPTPPTISYTCQHSCILPDLLGCHNKSGQAWPYGMEPIISKLSCTRCNQEELLPSYILG